MIKQIKVWTATCDECGKDYSSGGYSCDVFDTKKELIEAITDQWADWQVKRGKVFCDKCRTYLRVSEVADKILSLEIGGEIEEECPCLFETCIKYPKQGCNSCNGTGKITRKRLLRDVVGKGG